MLEDERAYGGLDRRHGAVSEFQRIGRRVPSEPFH